MISMSDYNQKASKPKRITVSKINAGTGKKSPAFGYPAGSAAHIASWHKEKGHTVLYQKPMKRRK